MRHIVPLVLACAGVWGALSSGAAAQATSQSFAQSAGPPQVRSALSAKIDPAAQAEAAALFKRIYAKPDDLDALFRYAEVSAGLGDDEAAIGALERILYFKPDLPRVRLELGALYYRLGSYPMARSYFNAVLESQEVPEPVRQRVTGFLAAITRAERVDKPFSAFFQTGFRYQTNANAGPNSLLVRALGNDAILDSAFAQAPDWNWFGQGGMRFVQDLGTGRGDVWESAVFGYYAAQKTYSALDLGFLELTTGPRIATGVDGSWVRPYGLINTSSLGSNPYMSGAGVGLTVGYAVTPWLVLEPNIEFRWRDYSNSPDYKFASEQDGTLGSATLLARGRFAGVWGWQALASWFRNDTSDRYDWLAYDQAVIGAGLSRDFALDIAGQEQIWTLWLHGGYTHTHYDAAYDVVDPTIIRLDREWRTSLVLDAPLTAVAGLGASISYSKVNSNLPNYDTTNWSFSFGPYARF
jgi:hypothetical protein